MTIDVSAPTADCRARHDAKDARACRRRDNNDAVVALGLPSQSADAIELSRQAGETVYDESIAFGHVVSVMTRLCDHVQVVDVEMFGQE